MLHHVICTKLIDPDMKQRIEKFDKFFDKRLYYTNFVDDIGDGFYIDDMDKYYEAAHGGVSNTLSD